MRFIVFITLVFVLGYGRVSPTPAPASQPTAKQSSADAVKLRRIEVTLLAPVWDAKGINAVRQVGPGIHNISISEPCDLRVRLPGGRVLPLRTRPALVIYCFSGSDVVMAVDAPPEERKGSLADKAREIEAILATWHLVLSSEMKDNLKQWKKTPIGGPIAFTLRSHSAHAWRSTKKRKSRSYYRAWRMVGTWRWSSA